MKSIHTVQLSKFSEVLDNETESSVLLKKTLANDVLHKFVVRLSNLTITGIHP